MSIKWRARAISTRPCRARPAAQPGAPVVLRDALDEVVRVAHRVALGGAALGAGPDGSGSFTSTTEEGGTLQDMMSEG